MSRIELVAALGFGILVFAANQAFAQSNCAPRQHMVTTLNDNYGETRQSMGLTANNRMMELYASSDTGSWTITVTLPNGMSCLVASGHAFDTIPTTAPIGPEEKA